MDFFTRKGFKIVENRKDASVAAVVSYSYYFDVIHYTFNSFSFALSDLTRDVQLVSMQFGDGPTNWSNALNKALASLDLTISMTNEQFEVPLSATATALRTAKPDPIPGPQPGVLQQTSNPEADALRRSAITPQKVSYDAYIVWTELSLRKALYRKTKAEIKAILGPPDRSSGGIWCYSKLRVYDPDTEKAGGEIYIEFDKFGYPSTLTKM